MATYATFPGVDIRKADLILTTGVLPSACHVTAVARDYPQTTGNLTIGEEGGVSFTLYDCAVENIPTTEQKPWRGQRMHMVIRDRRWKWQHKQLNGRYNVPCPDGTIEEDTKATYKDLIELALEEMGEDQPVVELPESPPEAPYVNWESASATSELSWLLDRIGCVLSLGLDNIVRVSPIGVGPEYPPNGKERIPPFNQSTSDKPYEISVKYAPTVFNMRLKLEAVGLSRCPGRDGDEDNEVQVLPIEELEYAPTWLEEVPDWFNGITDSIDRRLACRSVYRWYRITSLDDGSKQLPTGETIDSIFDVLPLRKPLLRDKYNTSDKGEHLFARPRVHGYFFYGDMTGINAGDTLANSTREFVEYEGDFDIDYDRGIVMFPRPVFEVDENGYHIPAELYLTCTFHARLDDQRGRIAYSHTETTGLTDDETAGTFQVEQLDMSRQVIQKYEYENRESFSDNVGELDDIGEGIVGASLHQLSWPYQAYVEWDGIVLYSPCGTIPSMRWLLGAGPAKTYGAAGQVPGVLVPSRKESRIREDAGTKPGTYVRMAGEI
jgi:hypothetical protein